MKGKM